MSRIPFALSALGQRYAPLFAAFAALIEDRARAEGLTQVWFFTREGIFFKQAQDAFQAGLGAPPLDTRLLHVSRLATFAASLALPLDQSLQRLWSQYGEQSAQDLLTSLGLTPADWAPLLAAQGQGLASPAQSLALQNTALGQRLEQAIAEKRENLVAYLDAVGFPKEGKALVVDIGWRGTIQDNLAWVRPKVTLHGAYLGLLPRLNQEPSNVASKTALIADLAQSPEKARLLSNALPFEMLTNGLGGSVTGYCEGSPVRLVLEQEEAIFHRFTEAVQAGMVNEIHALGTRLRGRPNLAEHLQPQALALWSEILHHPAPFFIEALLELEHNNTFGDGSTIRYGKGITWGLLGRCLISSKARYQLRVASAGLPWKRRLRRHPGVSSALKAWLYLEPAAYACFQWLKRNR